MTPQLRHTLCDHAAGNYRILTTMAAQLLTAAAQRRPPYSTRSSTSTSSPNPRPRPPPKHGRQRDPHERRLYPAAAATLSDRAAAELLDFLYELVADFESAYVRQIAATTTSSGLSAGSI